MPRRPDLPCADCGQLMWRGNSSRPEGQARCRPCRRQRPVFPHGETGYSKHKCRCDICREAVNAAGRAYRLTVLARDGMSPTQKYRPSPWGGTAPCTGCGTPITARSTRPMCRPCRRQEIDAKRAAKRKRATAAQRLTRAAAGRTGNGIWCAGDCASCGTPFVRRGQPSPYCSQVCSRREKAARRRALEAGAKITPGRRFAVHERDNWRCTICGDPVNRDAKVPELDAPVIDHRIPLARGGSHGADNWQTAHFYCNSVKRDLLDSEVA